MTINTITDPSLHKRKERALLIGASTTFLSLIPTAYAAFASNSVVLFTDLMRCTVEFLAIALAWLVVNRVGRGLAGRFDYGAGKLEHLSSIGVGLAMLATVVAVLVSALHRALSPEEIYGVEFGFVLGLLSILGNVTLWVYYRHLANLSPSPLMQSQWKLFRAKTFSSVIVVLSLLPPLLGSSSALVLYSDPVGSVLLSGFLLYSAIGLLSASMKELTDASLDEALQLLILKTLVKFEHEYHGLRLIRSRRSGTRVMIELFLEFDAELSLAAIDRCSAKIKTEIEAVISNSEVVVVPFPFVGKDK